MDSNILRDVLKFVFENNKKDRKGLEGFCFYLCLSSKFHCKWITLAFARVV